MIAHLRKTLLSSNYHVFKNHCYLYDFSNNVFMCATHYIPINSVISDENKHLARKFMSSRLISNGEKHGIHGRSIYQWVLRSTCARKELFNIHELNKHRRHFNLIPYLILIKLCKLKIWSWLHLSAKIWLHLLHDYCSVHTRTLDVGLHDVVYRGYILPR